MNSVYEIVGKLGNLTGWRLSNLKIQKAVYLCQMFYMGEQEKPLFPEDFEAWDYGPVVPSLYHTLKMFGSSPVKELSIMNSDARFDEEAENWISQVAELANSKSSGRLVAITHWEQGAWSKHYVKGMQGIVIPKSSIVGEYNTRLESRNEKAKKAG